MTGSSSANADIVGLQRILAVEEKIAGARSLKDGSPTDTPSVAIIVVDEYFPSFLREHAAQVEATAPPVVGEPMPAVVFAASVEEAAIYVTPRIAWSDKGRATVRASRYERFTDVPNTPGPRVVITQMAATEERPLMARAVASKLTVGSSRIVELSRAPSSGIQRALIVPKGAKTGTKLPEESIILMATEAAAKRGIDPRLIAAIAKRESAFNSKAESPRGARGLMQVMPTTGAEFGVQPSDLWDPQTNVYAGVRYLEVCIARARKIGLEKDQGGEPAIAAYNMGAGRLKVGWKLSDAPAETEAYVPAIQETYEDIIRRYPNGEWDRLWPLSIPEPEPGEKKED